MESLADPSALKDSSDYFSGLREWDALKWFFVLFHLVMTFVGPAILYSIIWYESSCSNAHYRTVVNMLLSNTAIICLVSCFFTRIPYVIIVTQGPFPDIVCDISVMLSKYGFLCILTEIALWQVMKYLYIFHWKNVVSMNDAFIANFLTISNLLINGVVAVGMYMTSLSNVEIDYHICTGRNPILNVNSIQYLILKNPSSNNTYKELNDSDLTITYNEFYVIVVLLVSLRIWIYDKKLTFLRLFKKIEPIFHCNKGEIQCGVSTISSDDHFDYMAKTKSMIIGAGGSVVVGSLIFLLMLPAYFSKKYEIENFPNVNYGKGRVLFYVSRISLPLLRYCSLPFACFCSSPKLRSTLMHKLKCSLSKS